MHTSTCWHRDDGTWALPQNKVFTYTRGRLGTFELGFSWKIKCPTIYLLILYYGFLPLPQLKIGFLRPLPHMNNGMDCQTVANPSLHPLNLVVKVPCKVSMLSTFTHHRVGTQAKKLHWWHLAPNWWHLALIISHPPCLVLLIPAKTTCCEEGRNSNIPTCTHVAPCYQWWTSHHPVQYSSQRAWSDPVSPWQWC